MTRTCVLSFLIAVTGVQGSMGQDPTEPATVWLGDELAVSYRARIEGEWLIVEAQHEPGWHTYAQDNLRRAREKSGNENPETELGTVITPSSGLVLAGDWRQTPPKDMSQPDIGWYTWGFEGRSYFAARVQDAGKDPSVWIDGQACTDTVCAMVEELKVPVESTATDGRRTVDPASLEVVR